MPTLNIIGAGLLGKTMGRLWHQAGVFEIQDVLNRSAGSSNAAVAFIGAGRALIDLSGLRPADLWLIATPDSHIEACCRQLVDAKLLNQGQVVFHCSGALSSQSLNAAAEAGAATASVHPVRSFADPAHAAANFAGTWCGVEGDPRALALLQLACDAIGARAVLVDAQYKAVYHAASVFAANYLVTLLDVALQAYARAGLPPELASQMMEPLVRGSVDNVFALGPAAALTGPIARGDTKTVERQQQAVMEWDADIGALYRQLALHTEELARRKRAGEKRGNAEQI